MSEVPEEVTDSANPPDPEAVPEEPEDPGIQIGDQTFKTEAAALAFAREQLRDSEVERARADAYRQGIIEAQRNVTFQPNVTQAPAKPDKTALEQEFYSDPIAAMERVRAQAIAEAEQKILGRVGQQNEEQRLWSKFSDANPDLADFKKDVELIGDEYKEIIVTLHKTKGEDEAMKFIAQKTRAKFQQYADKAKPSRELPKAGGASPSGSGAGGKVTPARDGKNPPKPTSFIEQIQENKRRRARV